MKHFSLLLVILALCVSCDNSTFSPSAPSPVQPPTEPTIPEPVVRPRVDIEPNLDDYVGLTNFSLTLRDEEFIYGMCDLATSKGYNTLRVGAELAEWGFTYHPKGPEIRDPQALANLRRMLDATARCPGIFVQLMPVFTIKEQHPFSEQKWWLHQVNEVVKDYRHVYYEVINEYYVHSHYDRAEVIELLNIARESGKLIGTDDYMAPGHYVHSFKRFVDYISFHTFRNPDPNVNDLRKLMRKNRHPVILSETTCYSEVYSAEDNSLYTNDRQQILDLMYASKAAGTKWLFHSDELLETTSLSMWIPEYR